MHVLKNFYFRRFRRKKKKPKVFSFKNKYRTKKALFRKYYKRIIKSQLLFGKRNLNNIFLKENMFLVPKSKKLLKYSSTYQTGLRLRLFLHLTVFRKRIRISLFKLTRKIFGKFANKSKLLVKF